MSEKDKSLGIIALEAWNAAPGGASLSDERWEAAAQAVAARVREEIISSIEAGTAWRWYHSVNGCVSNADMAPLIGEIEKELKSIRALNEASDESK